ncbi:MAG: hypothetical protein J5786_02555 [Clostridiales bacterium]|nr:hypothetical protein [Clostridiales bacterium]
MEDFTNTDFKHLLKAGHGRAYLIAREDPGRYKDKILSICRHDYTFDMQSEGSRAFLTADLIRLFEDQTPFIDAARESFKESEEYAQIQYLSDLLMEFGMRKDIVEKYIAIWKKIEETPYEKLKERGYPLLEDVEYLAIKLICGASWKTADNIIKDMGRWYLQTGDRKGCSFMWFYSCLEDEFGEEETEEHVISLSKTSPEAEAFYRHDVLRDWAPRITEDEIPTAPEIVSIFEEGKELRGLDILHMGIHKMSDEEKKKLAQMAVDTDNIRLRTQIVSLYITERMVWPLEISYLLSWCDEGDEDLRDSCEEALTLFEAPGIREYALRTENVPLLICNYKPQDEELLMDLLMKIEIDDNDDNDWHHIRMLITDKDLPDRFLCWVYETTLCSFCRECVVSDLIERGTFPERYREECMWDADLDIRALIEGGKDH